jgi:translation initiation factor IF-1
MVKNSTGGNKSKKQARSSGAGNTPQQNVRKALEEGEIYAVVTKINGGNNCQVMCNDGIVRCCFIRNKFKTYGKRENTMAVGIWILAGIRLWESRTSGVQKCDLLEVYSQTEKDRLKQTETCSFQHLLNAVEADRNSKASGGVDFSSTMEEEELFETTAETDSEDDSSSDDGSKKKAPATNKKASTLKELMKTTQIKNDDNDWLNEAIDVNHI